MESKVYYSDFTSPPPQDSFREFNPDQIFTSYLSCKESVHLWSSFYIMLAFFYSNVLAPPNQQAGGPPLIGS
jgi:hypothetical protein